MRRGRRRRLVIAVVRAHHGLEVLPGQALNFDRRRWLQAGGYRSTLLGVPRLLLLIRITATAAQGLHQLAQYRLLSTVVVAHVHLLRVADRLLKLLGLLARVVQGGLADAPRVDWSLKLFYR